MAKYSLQKIKQITKEVDKVIPLDLGKFLGEIMEGVVLPFKVRTYEETLKLKNKYKLDSGLATTKYMEFSRVNKDLKEFYEKHVPVERKNVTRFVYVFDAVADGPQLAMLKFKERILDVFMNVDMDSVSESGVTLWEDLEIENGDYVALVETFSKVIIHEDELHILESIVHAIKSGLRDEMQISIRVAIQSDLRKIMSIPDEDERNKAYKDYQDSFTKVQHNLLNTVQEMDKKIRETAPTEEKE
ncbi:MAG: hypothetical protein ACRCRT_03825 [Cetobacterium somerae]